MFFFFDVVGAVKLFAGLAWAFFCVGAIFTIEFIKWREAKAARAKVEAEKAAAVERGKLEAAWAAKKIASLIDGGMTESTARNYVRYHLKGKY